MPNQCVLSVKHRALITFEILPFVFKPCLCWNLYSLTRLIFTTSNVFRLMLLSNCQKHKSDWCFSQFDLSTAKLLIFRGSSLSKQELLSLHSMLSMNVTAEQLDHHQTVHKCVLGWSKPPGTWASTPNTLSWPQQIGTRLIPFAAISAVCLLYWVACVRLSLCKRQHKVFKEGWH